MLQCPFYNSKYLYSISRSMHSLKANRKYEVVIAGGGSGGIAVAARLQKIMPKQNIAIIDRAKVA